MDSKYDNLRKLALECKDLKEKMVFAYKTYQTADMERRNLQVEISAKEDSISKELLSLDLGKSVLLDIDGIIYEVNRWGATVREILK